MERPSVTEAPGNFLEGRQDPPEEAFGGFLHGPRIDVAMIVAGRTEIVTLAPHQTDHMNAGLAKKFLAVGAFHHRNSLGMVVAAGHAILEVGRALPHPHVHFGSHHGLNLTLQNHGETSHLQNLAIGQLTFLHGSPVDERAIGRAQIGHQNHHGIHINLAVALGNRWVIQTNVAVTTPTNTATAAEREIIGLCFPFLLEDELWHNLASVRLK